MITTNFGIKDQLHDQARKDNPDNHWPGILKLEICDREYRDNFCPVCAFEYKDRIAEIYQYDARTDCYYKRIN